jgi:hypothetical protein
MAEKRSAWPPNGIVAPGRPPEIKCYGAPYEALVSGKELVR